MKIQIHKVNNRENEEHKKTYNEKELLTGKVHLSDNFEAAESSYRLVLNKNAVQEMFDFIQWEIGERPDIRVEQGGILLGKRFYDSEKKIHFVVVSKAITADNAVGSAGYLDISHECWGQMCDKQTLYNEQHGDDALIIGWFHTHPNSLSCFMSGTDRNTQSLFFDGDNTYAIVINPQRHLMKAFRSKSCIPTQAVFVIDSCRKTGECK